MRTIAPLKVGALDEAALPIVVVPTAPDPTLIALEIVKDFPKRLADPPSEDPSVMAEVDGPAAPLTVVALLTPATKSPCLIVNPPEKVLAPMRVVVPVLVLIRPPMPEIMPESVLEAELPTSTVTAKPPLPIVPDKTKPVDAETATVGAAELNVILFLIKLVPIVLLMALAPPSKVKALPIKVKPSAEKVIDANVAPTRSLFGVRPVEPVKTKASPLTPVGATPSTQFPAVLKLLSPPSPSQVKVVACA